MTYTISEKEVSCFEDLVRKDVLAYVQYDYRGQRLLLWPRYLHVGSTLKKIAPEAVPDAGGMPVVVPANIAPKWTKSKIEDYFGRMVVARINAPHPQTNNNYPTEPHYYNSIIDPTRRDSAVEFELFSSNAMSSQLVQVVYVMEGNLDFSKPFGFLVHPYADQAQPKTSLCLIAQVDPRTRKRLFYGPFECTDSIPGACSMKASTTFGDMVYGIAEDRFKSCTELVDENEVPYASFVDVGELEKLAKRADDRYDWMSDEDLLASIGRLAKSVDPSATRQQIRSLKEALSSGAQIEGLAEVDPARKDRIVSLLGASEAWSELSDSGKRELVDDIDPADIAEFVLHDECFDGFMEKALEDGRVRERYEEHIADLEQQIEDKEGSLRKAEDKLDAANAELAEVGAKREKLLAQVREEHEAELGAVKADVASLELEKKDLEKEIEKLGESKYAANQAVQQVIGDFKSETRAGGLLLESVLIRELAQELAGTGASQLPARPAAPRASALPAAPKLLDGADVLTPASVLDRLYEFVTGRGGRELERNEVANLAICLTQGYMTVLAGTPGTGKTSLASILASALGLRQAGATRFCEVSVERGWTSCKDLIGYSNPLTGDVEPAATGLFEAFQDMDQVADLDAPYLVLLDEANLSSIEHYWSPFLLACDRFEQGAFEIPLGGGIKVSAPPSLRFVSTVNFDHTTEELSPRFIDRSWVIMLDPVEISFDSAGLSGGRASFDDVEALPASALHRAFGPREGLPQSLRAKLSEVLSTCAESGVSVSARSQMMMMRYVSAAAAVMDLGSAATVNDPVDFAVCQKVLPMLSGSEMEVANALEELAALGGLPRTKRRSEEMLRKGSLNGYYRFFA